MRALEFITGHVIYNLAYTYKFQLKTTLVMSKQSGRFFQIFVAFSEYLNFISMHKRFHKISIEQFLFHPVKNENMYSFRILFQPIMTFLGLLLKQVGLQNIYETQCIAHVINGYWALALNNMTFQNTQCNECGHQFSCFKQVKNYHTQP